MKRKNDKRKINRKKMLGTLTIITLGILMVAVIVGCTEKKENVISVDLYDYKNLVERDYYDIFFEDYLPEGKYGAWTEDFEVELLQDRIRLKAPRQGKGEVYIGIEGGEVKILQFEFFSTAEYNVINGGFERGNLEGWNIEGEAFDVSDEVTYFDNIYTPVPIVGQDGWYFLDGFDVRNGMSRESALGSISSSEFTAAGSGYITFKLGGGCSEKLSVSLFCGDELIDSFNNYMFSDPYRSIALTDYYYKIPEKYMGKKLHFVLSDWATDSFGGITADSFRTYYEKQPDLTGMYKAGNSVSENESEEWIIREGGNGTQRAYSPVFEVDENLMFTLEGGNSSSLNLRLLVDGEEIAVFNNWRKKKTTYIFEDEEIKGKTCRFILDDSDKNEELIVSDICSTTDVPDDKMIFLAGYIKGSPYDLDKHLRPDEAEKELNGNFNSLDDWFTVDLVGYSVYDDGEFFEDIYSENKPVYGADGKFLTGCYLNGDMSGLSGTGTLYSRAFIADGSGYITFKLGGANIQTLYLRLMKYEKNGKHKEIARFNNYLFSDPYRSMSLTCYGYKLPQKYMGEILFFELVDEESIAAFGAMSLDSVKTFYEIAPSIYTGEVIPITNSTSSLKITDDKNIYPAGYMVPSFSDVTEKLNLAGAGKTLTNGDFENGVEGWFSADLNAFNAYKVSSESTYFDTIYPSNIPIFNKTGTYFLNGFGNETFTGKIYSQAFIANGWISFKLGGGNSESLKFRLMCYVDGVDDIEIACFNNYLFSDPYRSMALTRYAYKIPEKFDGKYCYFVIEDNSTTNFGAITVDEIKTSYLSPPVINGNIDDAVRLDTTFLAGYINQIV